jgi:hypothetical protein
MSRAVSPRLAAPGVALGLAMLALSACSAGPMGGGASSDAVGPSGTAAEGRTDLATQQACRQRVNEMYDIRDRGDIYVANPSVNTPFSANYQPGVPSRGLSGQFAYEQNIAECERNARNGAGEGALPPVSPPAAKGR